MSQPRVAKCKDMPNGTGKGLAIWQDKVSASSPQQVATPSVDDPHVSPEDVDTIEELLAVCIQSVLKCLHFARLGDLIYLGQ